MAKRELTEQEKKFCEKSIRIHKEDVEYKGHNIKALGLQLDGAEITLRHNVRLLKKEIGRLEAEVAETETAIADAEEMLHNGVDVIETKKEVEDGNE